MLCKVPPGRPERPPSRKDRACGTWGFDDHIYHHLSKYILVRYINIYILTLYYAHNATDTMLFCVSIWREIQNDSDLCTVESKNLLLHSLHFHVKKTFPLTIRYYPHLSSMCLCLRQAIVVAKPQEPKVEAAAADVAGPMEFHWTFARPCQTPGRSPLPTPKRTVLRRPCSLSL
jgi:hypothetical protein